MTEPNLDELSVEKLIDRYYQNEKKLEDLKRQSRKREIKRDNEKKHIKKRLP